MLCSHTLQLRIITTEYYIKGTSFEFHKHFIEHCLHRLVQTDQRLNTKTKYCTQAWKKKSNNKWQHEICIKREEKQNRAIETFINIENTTIWKCVFPLAVSTSLCLALLFTSPDASRIITQIHFILTNASVATISHRESNSAPMHIFWCMTA